MRTLPRPWAALPPTTQRSGPTSLRGRKQRTENADAAADYAGRGWPVLPVWWPAAPGCCACPQGAECSSPGKHPYAELAPRGLEDATTDVGSISRWWRDTPDLNIGLRTGIAFDVLDLDRA